MYTETSLRAKLFKDLLNVKGTLSEIDNVSDDEIYTEIDEEITMIISNIFPDYDEEKNEIPSETKVPEVIAEIPIKKDVVVSPPIVDPIKQEVQIPIKDVETKKEELIVVPVPIQKPEEAPKVIEPTPPIVEAPKPVEVPKVVETPKPVEAPKPVEVPKEQQVIEESKTKDDIDSKPLPKKKGNKIREIVQRITKERWNNSNKGSIKKGKNRKSKSK